MIISNYGQADLKRPNGAQGNEGQGKLIELTLSEMHDDVFCPIVETLLNTGIPVELRIRSDSTSRAQTDRGPVQMWTGTMANKIMASHPDIQLADARVDPKSPQPTVPLAEIRQAAYETAVAGLKSAPGGSVMLSLPLKFMAKPPDATPKWGSAGPPGLYQSKIGPPPEWNYY